MAKNKSKSTATAGKTKSQLTSVVFNSFAVVLIVVVAALLYLLLVDDKARQQAQIAALSQAVVDGQAALLNQHIEALQRQLSGVAGSPELITRLQAVTEGGEPQALLADLEQQYQRTFPGVISLRILPLGQLGIAELSTSKLPLRNNIEVDLVRRASNGDTPLPEAYRFEQKWVTSMAQPVIAGGQEYALGALLISFDDRYLAALISHRDGALGKTELIQRFGSKPQLIVSAGNGGLSTLRSQQDTSVPHWQLVFIPSPSLASQKSGNPYIGWILFGVCLAVIIFAAVHTYTALKKALVDNIMQVLQANKGGFTLPGFTELSQRFQSVVAKAGKEQEAAAARQKSAAHATPKTEEVEEVEAFEIPDRLFRAYDIRGDADTDLTDVLCRALGQAIGSEALDQGQQSVIVAADGRHSSPRIRDAVVSGIRASGRDVIDIGTVPTPLMYFATHQLGTQSGVIITGSHHPPEVNGLKIVIAGNALSGDGIEALKKRVSLRQFSNGKGQYRAENIIGDYVSYIVNDIAIAQPLKVVIDAGNGVAGSVAPQLLEELGCEVLPLHCDIDGDFPNHYPDPGVPANLSDLIVMVKEHGADIGIALDGDGDRLGVVTASGRIVAADDLLMLFAQDIVSRNPGADVLFDVKCTRSLNTLISQYGGRPIMWKTGHSFMKAKMQETGALLGGEYSGHVFFKERWFGFDDGIYAATRLIEILSTTNPDLDAQLAAFPQLVNTPEIKVAVSDTEKFAIVDLLIGKGDFADGKVTTLDGVRVDYPDGWGLVRASNTSPALAMRFEAENETALRRIQDKFKEQLININSGLELTF